MKFCVTSRAILLGGIPGGGDPGGDPGGGTRGGGHHEKNIFVCSMDYKENQFCKMICVFIFVRFN